MNKTDRISPEDFLEHHYPGSSSSMIKFREDVLRLCTPPCSNEIESVTINGEIGVGKTTLGRVIGAIREMIKEGTSVFSYDLDQHLDNYRTVLTPPGEGDLIDAEIFGYVKGAFTGAEFDKPAIFEDNDNDPTIKTVFFDEIGRASTLMQSKLLGVYDGKRYKKVGDQKERHTEAMFISASNQDLPKLVKKGKFLEELYSRLGITITIPPLRERSDQIIPLIQKISSNFHRKLSEKDLQWAATYRWPTNVRQIKISLQNYSFHKEKSFQECTEMTALDDYKNFEINKQKQIKSRLNSMYEEGLTFNGTAADFIKMYYAHPALEAMHSWAFDYQCSNEKIETIFSQEAEAFKAYLANAMSKRRKSVSRKN